jgi:uncharacterized protein YndB with AHSA1/START domain
MSELTEHIVVEADLEEAPDKVWRALSEPELLGAWLYPNDIRPEPGERFGLDDAGRRIDCEVLEAEPGRRLRYSWREADGGVDSEVSFVLTPTPAGGTHLRVVHGPVVVSLSQARARREARLQTMRGRTTMLLARAA